MNQLYSTYKDILNLVPQLYEETEDTADSISVNTIFPILNTQRINNYIKQADGRINANLHKLYGTDLTIDPYYAIPTPNYNNVGDGAFNYTNGSNAELTLNTSWTGTDVIEIIYSDSSAFTVNSQLYGALGTGSINTTFTSNPITFDSTFWVGTPSINDRFYIRTYNIDQILVEISSQLAASQILNSVYTENIPNQAGTSKTYNRQASECLRDLRKTRLFLSKGISDINLDPIQVDYEIDDYGNDVTNYKDAEWNRRKQTDYLT